MKWGLRVCKKCGEKKPLTAFYQNPCYSGGYCSCCKECERKKKRIEYHSKKFTGSTVTIEESEINRLLRNWR